ncbi:MAG TPA: hypothetical protein VFI28_12895 [Candidatus Limnocylindrales bacterium]|nr:hypothetical protein [Candidatus Limnocylindrales bacterium]
MTALSIRRARAVDLSPVVGVAAIVAVGLVFLVCARLYDAHRGDFFYLADAFLHGRTWLDVKPGPQDVIAVDDRYYVPFGPFPAILLAPLVALLGPQNADALEPAVDALLAAAAAGLGWWLTIRGGVERLTDRLFLVALLAFSTPLWWITTRGGVWHTGQLVATVVTLAALVEAFGRRRAVVLGLLAGAAFLSRAPLAFAVPFYAWAAAEGARGRTANLRPGLERAVRSAVIVGVAAAPSLAFFLWYNAVRFGSPLESGYALAVVPPFLEVQRQAGLFSLAHLSMNLDYLLIHLPRRVDAFPFFQPDGFGLSIFLTSPGFLVGALAPWRSSLVRALGLTTLAVLVPSLLYYGGGWLQYGYRYALDALPFLFAIVVVAVARRGMPTGGRLLIGLGILVNAGGIYWAYRL